MENILVEQYWTIDIFSLIVILIPFFSVIKSKKTFSRGIVYYKWAIVTLIILLVADGSSWSFNKKGPNFYYASLISATILFTTQPIFYGFWVLYSIRICNIKTSRADFLFLLPGLATFVYLIINLFVPNFIFYITKDGAEYIRGSYLWLYYATASLELIPTVIIFIVQRKNIKKSTFVHTLSIYFAVLLVSIIQIFSSYGLNIILPTISIGVLLTYIFVVNKTLEKDPLTGLNNRLQLEEYLSQISKLKKKYKFIIGLMLDLNHFKSINDRLGHKEGDIALQQASKILTTSIGKDDYFLARYAGDEFVIIIPTDNPQNGVDLIEKIKANEGIVNKQNKKYKLDFAIGEIVFDTKTDFDETTFMDAIDNDMYDQKSR